MITARKSVAKAKAYSAPVEGRRGFLRLDFNENTQGIKAISRQFGDVESYPEYQELISRLAVEFSLPEENILLTNGSSEGLFLSSFCFIEPGEDRALTTKPTFALIPQNLSLTGAWLIEIEDTEELKFDLARIEAALNQNIKVAVFASPNNPTGDTLPADKVVSWCRKFSETLFVIDEAYIDYGGETLIDMVSTLDNLIVLRTFSKAWGIAGLRLGLMAGAKGLIREIRKVKAPYSVNSQAVAAALKLLNRRSEISTQVAKITGLRKELEQEISNYGYQTIFGQGNSFLLGAGIDAPELTAFCRNNGVLVRNQTSSEKIKGYIRVTIGSRDECWKFINCLDEFRKKSALIFDLDDTLVDTSESYDATVIEMVKLFSGDEIKRQELINLRREGGFNDDWVATGELLRRRGLSISQDEIIPKARELYLKIAREKEKLFVDKNLLKDLGKRYRLFILTGRYRQEYEPVWSELDEIFEQVYCLDDFENEKPKPSGEMLLSIMAKNQIQLATYIGNSIDDMQAARSAGIRAFAITSNMAASDLIESGADLICNNVNELAGVFKA